MRDPRSPDEIMHEIDVTRARIRDTLAAMEEQISVENLVARSLVPAKEGTARFVSTFGRAVQDNPVAFTLTGIGLAWLMLSRNGDGSRRRFALEAEDEPDEVGERLDPSRSEAGSVFDEAASARPGNTRAAVDDAVRAAREKASRASAAVGRSAEEAYRWASERGRNVGSRSREMVSSGWEGVRSHPLTSGLAILGLGAAIALLVAPGARRAVGERAGRVRRRVAPDRRAGARPGGGERGRTPAGDAAEQAAAELREAARRAQSATVAGGAAGSPSAPAGYEPARATETPPLEEPRQTSSLATGLSVDPNTSGDGQGHAAPPPAGITPLVGEVPGRPVGGGSAFAPPETEKPDTKGRRSTEAKPQSETDKAAERPAPLP
jgi:hypothetical protein